MCRQVPSYFKTLSSSKERQDDESGDNNGINENSRDNCIKNKLIATTNLFRFLALCVDI